MRIINLTSGIPGSGKTTWIRNNAAPEAIQLHRDDFRAELRTKLFTDAYFPVAATEEWKLWTNLINTTLTENPDTEVYIDQTTIGLSALNKIYNALTLTENDKVVVHVFNLPLSLCKARNNTRTGHERVPDDVMNSMYKNFTKNLITVSSAKRVDLSIKVVFHNEH